MEICEEYDQKWRKSPLEGSATSSLGVEEEESEEEEEFEDDELKLGALEEAVE